MIGYKEEHKYVHFNSDTSYTVRVNPTMNPDQQRPPPVSILPTPVSIVPTPPIHAVTLVVPLLGTADPLEAGAALEALALGPCSSVS